MLPGSLYFGPVLDDGALPRHPFYPDAPPLSNDLPLLLGNTRDETRTLIGRAHPECFELGWDGLAGRIAEELWGRTDIDADRVVREYRRLYPSYTPSEVFFAATTAGRSWRGQVIEAELRARANAPTWVYELDWRSPLDGGRWRAPHTLDIPLAFDNTDVPDALSGSSKAAVEMASVVSRVFIAFARTGDPNVDGLPSWPQYRLERRAFRHREGLSVFVPRLLRRKRSVLTREALRLWVQRQRRAGLDGRLVDVDAVPREVFFHAREGVTQLRIACQGLRYRGPLRGVAQLLR